MIFSKNILAVWLLALAVSVPLLTAAQSYELKKVHPRIYEVRVENYEQIIHQCGNALEDFLAYAEAMPDGEVRVLNSSGQAVHVMHYQDGQRQGEELRYFPNGKVEYKAIWRNDTLGPYTWWYPNGQMRWQRDHHHVTSWYENGQKEAEGKFINGRYRKWYHNGQLKETGQYGDTFGKKVGEWRYYNKKGKLTETREY